MTMHERTSNFDLGGVVLVGFQRNGFVMEGHIIIFYTYTIIIKKIMILQTQ